MTAKVLTHWLFALLLCCGVALRVVVQLTYEPALFFFDSFTYLVHAVDPTPDTPRPLGYSILVLWPLLGFHDLAVIPLVQHLCGLAMASGVYAVLLRRGVRRWLAALAVAPVLLDGYQLQIEQNVASDTVFLALITAALALLMWRPRPSYVVVAGSGLLLGLAATVRFVGGPLVLVALLFVLVVSRGRSRLLGAGLLVATAALPLLVYSTWSYQHTGDFRPGGDSMSARTLYARTAPLADCRRLADAGAPTYVLRLCPPAPPDRRVEHPRHYMLPTLPDRWSVPGLPPGTDRYDVLREFGTRVLLNQPVDVATAVLDDLRYGFAWQRFQPPDAWPLETWRFPLEPRSTGAEVYDEATTIERFGGEPPSVDRGPATFLRDYQAVGYARGPVFALGIVLAVLAALGLGGARRSGLRAPAVLVAGTGLALLLAAAAFSFSWRYQLPSITLLPWAAALGLAAIWPAARAGDAPWSDPEERAEVDEDSAAVGEFLARHGRPRLAPVVVVVAAFNEAEAIPDVLEEIPAEVLGLRVDVLVVDDGSVDGTADLATGHGAHVARLAGNRGQGAALRVGYRIARETGARFLATTDADGQYDARELATVLRPVVDGEADFVTGSRRLGSDQTPDRLRSLGVRVFAGVVSLLTGTRVTDPANGLRAMRADVTGAVTLRQPQYQAAELLIAVIAHGFRVTERPTTMRRRAAGTSKKGPNLLYGWRFARVVVGTWRRERRARRGHPGPLTTGSEPSGPGR